MRILELFTDSCCLSRRNSFQIIQNVLKNFPDIVFKEVNILDEAQRAESLGVRMSPTLVLDGKIISVGVPDEGQLKTCLAQCRKGACHG